MVEAFWCIWLAGSYTVNKDEKIDIILDISIEILLKNKCQYGNRGVEKIYQKIGEMSVKY